MEKRAEIKAKLNSVFREIFDNDGIEIYEDMTAEDLDEWDSVAHISLVLAVEHEFKVSLNAADIGELANVGAMLDLLVGKLGS